MARFFGCCKRQLQLQVLSFDRDCLSSLKKTRLLELRPAFTGLVVLCSPPTSAGSLAFVPWVLRPTANAESSRSHWVRQTNFVPITSSLHRQHHTDIGLWHCELPYPLPMPYDASFSFATVTHLWLPSDLPLREQTGRYASRRVDRCSGQRPCLIDVGFPLVGPRDRICVSRLFFSGVYAHLRFVVSCQSHSRPVRTHGPRQTRLQVKLSVIFVRKILATLKILESLRVEII